jgi:cytoskeletal protein RodZ
MDNVSVHVNHGANSGRHMDESQSGHKMKYQKGRKKLFILSIGVVIVVALAVLGILSFYRSSTAAVIDTSKYQAVFFTNGQVYFGKLQVLNANYMSLTDVFYLQTKSTTTDSTNPQQTTPQSSSDVQLIKLGDEIHGPSDQMVINKDQVLFFENLKSDGKVTQSITAYQAKK